jgi:hypothetical protein
MLQLIRCNSVFVTYLINQFILSLEKRSLRAPFFIAEMLTFIYISNNYSGSAEKLFYAPEWLNMNNPWWSLRNRGMMNKPGLQPRSGLNINKTVILCFLSKPIYKIIIQIYNVLENICQ